MSQDPEAALWGADGMEPTMLWGLDARRAEVTDSQ